MQASGTMNQAKNTSSAALVSVSSSNANNAVVGVSATGAGAGANGVEAPRRGLKVSASHWGYVDLHIHHLEKYEVKKYSILCILNVHISLPVITLL